MRRWGEAETGQVWEEGQGWSLQWQRVTTQWLAGERMRSYSTLRTVTYVPTRQPRDSVPTTDELPPLVLPSFPCQTRGAGMLFVYLALFMLFATPLSNPCFCADVRQQIVRERSFTSSSLGSGILAETIKFYVDTVSWLRRQRPFNVAVQPIQPPSHCRIHMTPLVIT